MSNEIFFFSYKYCIWCMLTVVCWLLYVDVSFMVPWPCCCSHSVTSYLTCYRPLDFSPIIGLSQIFLFMTCHNYLNCGSYLVVWCLSPGCDMFYMSPIIFMVSCLLSGGRLNFITSVRARQEKTSQLFGSHTRHKSDVYTSVRSNKIYACHRFDRWLPGENLQLFWEIMSACFF